MSCVHVEEWICVIWDCVKYWNEQPYPENAELLTADQDMAQVKKKGLKNLISNDVFEEVPFKNQITISSCWIIYEKYNDSERKIEAILAYCNFEKNSSSLNKESPTFSRKYLHLLWKYLHLVY